MIEKFLPRKHPLIYEINTAAWLFQLSQKIDRPVHLGDIPGEEWDRLKQAGMDYIWLMGIWKRSEEGRKLSLNDPEFHRLFTSVLPGWQPEDIIGSCYSIQSYVVDPTVGTMEDIDHTREELHRRNIGLILDFVPNHTGIDHPWVTEHPEYYIQLSETDYQKDENASYPINKEGVTLYLAHGRDPYFPPWTDTAQLNYFNPDTRLALLETLEIISSHCDGLRCDMAMLVLNDIFNKTWGWTNRNSSFKMPSEEFWHEATQRFSGLVWIGEAYWDTEWALQQMGFDYVYDKRLYDRLRHSSPREVYLHLMADLDYQSKLVRFIENHDEERSVMAFGEEPARAAAVLFSGLPGMKMYFQGQLEGRKIRLPLQIRASSREAVNTDIESFYAKLLSAISDEGFHSGVWNLITVLPDGGDTSGNIIAYRWETDNRILLVLVNLSPENSRGRIAFQRDISEETDYSFNDLMDRQSFSIGGKLMAHPGIRVQLAAYQTRIMEIKPLALPGL